MEIYLDNSATTMVLPEVAQRMAEIMTKEYGNPSSMHRKGVEGELLIRQAREGLAALLKCDVKNLYFTSGGTESDNMSLIGVAMANQRRGKHLITTKIEHPAILKTMKYLEEQGFSVSYLSVDRSGRISLEELKNSIQPDTILVSIMHTNNEIGSLQPIAQIGELIKSCNPNTLFHVDAVQGFGKAAIYPKRMKIDLLSVSSHKIHGPKGMGLLYVGDKVKINPIVFGGGQQNGLRSGTENVPGIVGIAMAAKALYENLDVDVANLKSRKLQLIKGLLELPGVQVNGLMTETGSLSLDMDFSEKQVGEAVQANKSSAMESSDGITSEMIEKAIEGTAPHIVSASFPGVRSEVLLHTLEDVGIYVSAGSACSSHKPEPSATLTAIGLDKKYLDCTIRFSMSVFTTEEEIELTIKALSEKLPILQRYIRH